MLGKVSGCGGEPDERNHACHHLLCPRWERPSQELGYALITLYPDHFPGLFATGILEEGGNMSTGQSGGSLQRQQILQAQCSPSVTPTTCVGIHEGPLHLSLRLEGHKKLTETSMKLWPLLLP